MTTIKHDYFIGLGSNMSSSSSTSFQLLQKALVELEQDPDIKLVKTSSCYLSKPVGPQEQDNYHNAVAYIQSTLEPIELLNVLQSIETRHGRSRAKEQRWGARTLDLDILLLGKTIIQDEQLTIPHKELENRSFVLIPLFEIAPELILPSGKKLKSLAENCDSTGIIKRIEITLWP